MKPRLSHRLGAWALALASAVLAVAGTTPAAAAPPATRGLPAEVEAALAQGGLPREAMVAWVEEVGSATRPRVAWQGDKLVNPA